MQQPCHGVGETRGSSRSRRLADVLVVGAIGQCCTRGAGKRQAQAINGEDHGGIERGGDLVIVPRDSNSRQARAVKGGLGRADAHRKVRQSAGGTLLPE